jgi:hypothetical protein
MKNPLISIGLDNHIVETIKNEVGHIVNYQYLPDIFSVNGDSFVHSQFGSHYLCPRGVLFYCYFDSPAIQRRALALSNTPTFPNVKSTILHDDKAISLISALSADPVKNNLDRGFINKNTDIGITCQTVAKWGEWHCGQGKAVFNNVANVPEQSILEPFIEGESHRILIVGDSVWQIRYDSDDWRKNVNSKITILKHADPELAVRSEKIAQNLGLSIVGIDYIINDHGAFLLEVNAYPGLDQIPEAEELFIDLAIKWAQNID